MRIVRLARGVVARACALLVTAFVAVLALAGVLIPSSPSGATTAATPTASPTPTAPHLPLNLRLLGIGVSVDVPLSLNGLLGLSPSNPSTPPPTTPVPPTSSQPSTPPTSAHPTPPGTSTTTATQIIGVPVGGGTGGQVAPPSRSHSSAPNHPSSPAHSSSSSHKGTGAIELSERLLTSSDTLLLVAVLAATGLAMLVFVRLSGRRGGHQS
jgi:hypothetical protein